MGCGGVATDNPRRPTATGKRIKEARRTGESGKGAGLRLMQLTAHNVGLEAEGIRFNNYTALAVDVLHALPTPS